VRFHSNEDKEKELRRVRPLSTFLLKTSFSDTYRISRAAGNWLFANRRWSDPNDPEELQLLVDGHHRLCSLFPEFAACSLPTFLRCIGETAQRWAKRSRDSPAEMAAARNCGDYPDVASQHMATTGMLPYHQDATQLQRVWGYDRAPDFPCEHSDIGDDDEHSDGTDHADGDDFAWCCCGAEPLPGTAPPPIHPPHGGSVGHGPAGYLDPRGSSASLERYSGGRNSGPLPGHLPGSLLGPLPGPGPAAVYSSGIYSAAASGDFYLSPPQPGEHLPVRLRAGADGAGPAAAAAAVGPKIGSNGSSDHDGQSRPTPARVSASGAAPARRRAPYGAGAGAGAVADVDEAEFSPAAAIGGAGWGWTRADSESPWGGAGVGWAAEAEDAVEGLWARPPPPPPPPAASSAATTAAAMAAALAAVVEVVGHEDGHEVTAGHEVTGAVAAGACCGRPAPFGLWPAAAAGGPFLLESAYS
jgi:hypothetical protein